MKKISITIMAAVIIPKAGVIQREAKKLQNERLLSRGLFLVRRCSTV